jgi:hypothetical protein
MYCTHWFNTIFAYSLPFEHLLRVWDVFLLEGMKTVFRVGLALLASGQDVLLGQPFEKLVASLNMRKFMFPALNRPPDSLLRVSGVRVLLLWGWRREGHWGKVGGIGRQRLCLRLHDSNGH